MADIVRRDLSRPLSPDRKGELRALVDDTVGEVDRILASYGSSVATLPAPSRQAYQFLAGLDFDSLPAEAVGETDRPAPGSVSLVGLQSFLDEVLDGLAQPITAQRAEVLYGSISTASKRIERYLTDNDLASGDLKPRSRSARGWLAFFSDRANYDDYLDAVKRAAPILEESVRRTEKFRAPALIRFRPMNGLYRLRGYADATQLSLATPMIRFSTELFGALADAALHRGSVRVLLEATSTDEYQLIQAELEALGGVTEQAAGVYHDLGASFERVGSKYFGGVSGRPRLTWSASFTARKFGHYNPITDTVMISRSLDRADVPEFVVDFVMYHELLHKRLGSDWSNGRRGVHTPQFRKEERRFEHYAAAEAAIERLARRQA